MGWINGVFIWLLVQNSATFCFGRIRNGHHRHSRSRRSYYPSRTYPSYAYNYYLPAQTYTAGQQSSSYNVIQPLQTEFTRRNTVASMPLPSYRMDSRPFVSGGYYPRSSVYQTFYTPQQQQQQQISSYPAPMFYFKNNIDMPATSSSVAWKQSTGSKRSPADKLLYKVVNKNKDVTLKMSNYISAAKKASLYPYPHFTDTTADSKTAKKRAKTTTRSAKSKDGVLNGFIVDVDYSQLTKDILPNSRHKINTSLLDTKAQHHLKRNSTITTLLSKSPTLTTKKNTTQQHGFRARNLLTNNNSSKTSSSAASTTGRSAHHHNTTSTQTATTTTASKKNINTAETTHKLKNNINFNNSTLVIDKAINDIANDGTVDYVDDEDDDDDTLTTPSAVHSTKHNNTIVTKVSSASLKPHRNVSTAHTKETEETSPSRRNASASDGQQQNSPPETNSDISPESTVDDHLKRNETLPKTHVGLHGHKNTTSTDHKMIKEGASQKTKVEDKKRKPNMTDNPKAGIDNLKAMASSIKEALGITATVEHAKAKWDDKTLDQSLKTNTKKQDELLGKDTTGEDIYKPYRGLANHPGFQEQLLDHDAQQVDWFDTAYEPSLKTKNDLKMSSDVLGKIAAVKMKSAKKPKMVAKPESSENYDKHVKKITDLAESTENEMLSNLIRDSLGGVLPVKKFNPLKLKNSKAKPNAKQMKESSEKSDESKDVKHLMSQFGDDFDVFVDKTAADQKAVTATPPIGRVVVDIRTMDDLPSNEGAISSGDSDGESSDVIATKKHLHASRKESTSKYEKSSMRRLHDKWIMFKKANKDILENTRKEIEEGSSSSKGAGDAKSKIGDKDKHKGVLETYFQEVENRQALDESNQLVEKQSKRKEKLKSTLNMISDIESEIDRMVNKEASEDESQHEAMKARRREHKKKKGKSKIFNELVDTANFKEEGTKPRGSAEQEFLYFKDSSKDNLENEGEDKQQVVNYEDDQKPGTYLERQQHRESQLFAVSSQPEPLPQAFMTKPVQEERITESPKGEDSVQKQTILEENQQLTENQNQKPENSVQKQAISEESQDEKSVADQQQQPVAQFKQKLAGQENVEENQLIQQVENSPGQSGNIEGNTIERTISSTDNNEYMAQQNDMRNLQRLEMQGDLTRLKEATQNGLRDMFSNAAQKQQHFIDNVEGGSRTAEDEPQPIGGSYEPPLSQRFLGGGDDEDEQMLPPAHGNDMMGEPMFGGGPPPPSMNEPFSPGNDINDGDGVRRRSGIMGLADDDDIDSDDDDDDDQGDTDDDNVRDGTGGGGGPTMFMAAFPQFNS